MRAKKWEEAKRDLTAALLQSVDIGDLFQSTHESITDFEEKFGVQFLLALRENGLYLSNSVIVDALREAGEI